MSVINGCLFDGIVQFHDPGSHANTAVIVIDEKDGVCSFETLQNYQIKRQSQEDVLRFCKSLGCKIIVVSDIQESRPKRIYNIIEEPDFSCVKQANGVLELETTPSLMDYIENNKITSLVIMGMLYFMCVRESLIGGCFEEKLYSGLLNRQITVLSSPKLLGPYIPETYVLEPKFSASATSYRHCTDYNFQYKFKWPIFTLHPGMRFYTKIREHPSLLG